MRRHWWKIAVVAAGSLAISRKLPAAPAVLQAADDGRAHLRCEEEARDPEIDGFARRRSVPCLLGSRPDWRTSDTPLQRIVPTIMLDEARQRLQTAYIETRQRGASFTLERGR